MRADRLVSLVLLLRQRGRLSAAAIAKELEVSTRTVLRDIDALSSAGIPVYAERGRHGGFSLLPDFTTDLTGLNHEEALALLVAGSRLKAGAFGLGAPLASAMLKVIDALPGTHRDTAAGVAERFLIEPEADLLARPLHTHEDIDAEVVTTIRSAVLNKHKVRIRYAAPGAEPSWRTIDPIGWSVRPVSATYWRSATGKTAPTGSRGSDKPNTATNRLSFPTTSIWMSCGSSAAGASATARTRSPSSCASARLASKSSPVPHWHSV